MRDIQFFSSQVSLVAVPHTTPHSLCTGEFVQGFVSDLLENYELPLRTRLTPAVMVGRQLESLRRLWCGALILPNFLLACLAWLWDEVNKHLWISYLRRFKDRISAFKGWFGTVLRFLN